MMKDRRRDVVRQISVDAKPLAARRRAHELADIERKHVALGQFDAAPLFDARFDVAPNILREPGVGFDRHNPERTLSQVACHLAVPGADFDPYVVSREGKPLQNTLLPCGTVQEMLAKPLSRHRALSVAIVRWPAKSITVMDGYSLSLASSWALE